MLESKALLRFREDDGGFPCNGTATSTHHLLPISSQSSSGLSIIRAAPASTRVALERKPQVTPRGKQPEFLAVSMSISESPTKTVSWGFLPISASISQAAAGSGLGATPGRRPQIASKASGEKKSCIIRCKTESTLLLSTAIFIFLALSSVSSSFMPG